MDKKTFKEMNYLPENLKFEEGVPFINDFSLLDISSEHGTPLYVYDWENIKNNPEKEKEQSVKAIALIRAYRIRGHLIAKLDPLNIMDRPYLHELHPDDHGFKKQDYNTQIYLNGYLDRTHANLNEILSFLKKTYCETIGAEYMHISDPNEKKWNRERMEK